MASYHGEDMMGVEPRREMLERIASAIARHLVEHNIPLNNLYLVGRGCSGVAMASTLSYILGCRWGLVRKSTDTDNHAWGGENLSTKGICDYVVAVDDFVCSGTTILKINDQIKIHAVATDMYSLSRNKKVLERALCEAYVIDTTRKETP